jgi:REP element-mobilizing transposase RayT
MADTFTNLLYHIIFSTKHRYPMIQPDWQQRLYAYLGGAIRGEKGRLLEIGGTSEHVHMLSKLSPAKALAKVIGDVKANASKWINSQHLLSAKFAWQRGYSAFTVSESAVPAVRHYIRNQETHHRRMTFEDELRLFLEKNGIAYDERFMLD